MTDKIQIFVTSSNFNIVEITDRIAEYQYRNETEIDRIYINHRTLDDLCEVYPIRYCSTNSLIVEAVRLAHKKRTIKERDLDNITFFFFVDDHEEFSILFNCIQKCLNFVVFFKLGKNIIKLDF